MRFQEGFLPCFRLSIFLTNSQTVQTFICVVMFYFSIHIVKKIWKYEDSICNGFYWCCLSHSWTSVPEHIVLLLSVLNHKLQCPRSFLSPVFSSILACPWTQPCLAIPHFMLLAPKWILRHFVWASWPVNAVNASWVVFEKLKTFSMDPLSQPLCTLPVSWGNSWSIFQHT